MFCQQIEIQAIFFIFNTNPRFPPLLLYVRCKSGVTFTRRSFRDVTEIPQKILMAKLMHAVICTYLHM